MLMNAAVLEQEEGAKRGTFVRRSLKGRGV